MQKMVPVFIVIIRSISSSSINDVFFSLILLLALLLTTLHSVLVHSNALAQCLCLINVNI